MKLGIDFGSSFTDAVVMEKDKIKKLMSFNKKDKLDYVLFKLIPQKFEEIIVTGSGSLKLGDKVKDTKIKKVDEIKAIGLGGLFTSKKKEALVVSIGSGTAMVSCKEEIKHIGGTPIGGGTVAGLGKLIMNVEELGEIEKLAKKGNLDNVDLTLKEIYPDGIGLLPSTATASHFGNLKEFSNNDVALGLINMAAQSIGTLAVFGAKSFGHDEIILTGRLTKSKIFKEIIEKRIASLCKIKVSIPKNAEYATAIGAVIGASLGI